MAARVREMEASVAADAESRVVVATWQLYHPCATPCPPASTMKDAPWLRCGAAALSLGKRLGVAKVQGRCRTVGPNKADVMAW